MAVDVGVSVGVDVAVGVGVCVGVLVGVGLLVHVAVGVAVGGRRVAVGCGRVGVAAADGDGDEMVNAGLTTGLRGCLWVFAQPAMKARAVVIIRQTSSDRRMAP